MTCRDLLFLKISLYLKSPSASSCAAQPVGLSLEAAREAEREARSEGGRE